MDDFYRSEAKCRSKGVFPRLRAQCPERESKPCCLVRMLGPRRVLVQNPIVSRIRKFGSPILILEVDMERIEGFFNQYRFLSNFEPSHVVYLDVTYPTVEHAYQAAKFIDPCLRGLIKLARTPGEAKKMGRLYTLRPDWEERKEDVMRDLLIQKFGKSPYMEMLLDTGDAYIEETNWWNDRYWGVCKGEGLNRLGLMLMDIRANLRELAF